MSPAYWDFQTSCPALKAETPSSHFNTEEQILAMHFPPRSCGPDNFSKHLYRGDSDILHQTGQNQIQQQ